MELLTEQLSSDKAAVAVARELHDNVGPSLSAAEIRIRRALRNGEGNADLTAALDEITEARTTIRELMSGLRGQANKALGLYDAISEQLGGFDDSMSVAFEYNSDYSVSPDVEGELAAIACEGIRNIKRHAAASAVRVAYNNFDGDYLLEIIDDGVGFEPAAIDDQRYGVLGMRERAEIIGATFRIHSTTDEGTVIQCTLNKI